MERLREWLTASLKSNQVSVAESVTLVLSVRLKVFHQRKRLKCSPATREQKRWLEAAFTSLAEILDRLRFIDRILG